MSVDYGAVADRLLKLSAKMAKERRRAPPPPRLDAFAVKACIEFLAKRTRQGGAFDGVA